MASEELGVYNTLETVTVVHEVGDEGSEEGSSELDEDVEDEADSGELLEGEEHERDGGVDVST